MVDSDLAADLALALDPAEVFRRGVGDPDSWQARVLRSGAPRVLLLCARQTGKSTTTAALALYEVLYRAGALVLLVSPSLRQSQELFRKVTGLYESLSRPVPEAERSALRLELANGSRLVSLPGSEKTVRGFSSVTLAVVDEAARVPDDLYRAVRPMLAVSGGRLVALSTPFGKRGWFHAEWMDAQNDWERVKVPATECSRISKEFLRTERMSLGQWWYRQEYECSFEDSVDAVFRYEDIHAALVDDVKPLWGVGVPTNAAKSNSLQGPFWTGER
jgi:hypothetical protein